MLWTVYLNENHIIIIKLVGFARKYTYMFFAVYDIHVDKYDIHYIEYTVYSVHCTLGCAQKLRIFCGQSYSTV